MEAALRLIKGWVKGKPGTVKSPQEQEVAKLQRKIFMSLGGGAITEKCLLLIHPKITISDRLSTEY